MNQTNVGLILLLIGLYISVALIDFWNYLIPNRLSGAAFVLAVCFLSLNLAHVETLLKGFLYTTLIFATLYIVSMGNFGMGDVKLSASMGMMLGSGLVMKYILWTFIVAGIVGALLLALKIKKKEDKIAFGPYMVVSFILMFVM